MRMPSNWKRSIGLAKRLDCGYISSDDAAQLNSGLEEIGRMLNSMMEKAESFCGSPDGVLREDATDYFTAAPTETDY